MFQWLRKIVCACTRKTDDDDKYDDDINADPLVWGRDLEMHSRGEFSMAAVQANEVMEDSCQVETGAKAIFVGVYDGHGGSDASRYITSHLFQNLIGSMTENGRMSEEIFRGAVLATEEGFMTLVRRGYRLKPELGKVGSCCLAGLIWKGTLYIANLGDSRAVIGSAGRFNRIHAEQLTRDHNAKNEDVRQELMSLHPEDPQIVFENRGSWRVKGIIEVSRAIGDPYLKRLPFTSRASFPKMEVPPPFTQAVVSADPELHSRVIQPNDRFIIFASDGLWELLTNQEAVEIVHNNYRNGSAKKLLKAALEEAARRMEIKYQDLQKVEKGRDTRRSFHDDISVIVVFIDHAVDDPEMTLSIPESSFLGFVDTVESSNFKDVPFM